MRARFAAFCLCAAISLLAGVSPAGAVDLLQAGQSAPRQGVLLDIPTSFRVLEVLEDYPRLKEENAALHELAAKQELLEEIRKEREALYQERIAFLEGQAAAWARLQEATVAMAEEHRKAQGTWFDRFRKDVGTFTLGGIAAAALIAAIAF